MEISKESKNSNNFKLINIRDIENSAFRTKKKTFVSEINPHIIRRNIQREQYIWFGVYDNLLRNKHMINSIKKCRDPSLPLECAAIHLEKYKICFNDINAGVRAFMLEDASSVVFIKLYLITKEQLIDLLKSTYDVEEEECILLNQLKDLNETNNKIYIENAKIYNQINCVGELDNILIYSLSTNLNLKIGPPDTEYLRNIYLGLKKSFHPYSEYLIMYYVYRIEGVRNFYTINQLKECFFKINTNNSESKISTEKTTNNNDDINIILNSDRKHDMCETIKCTTCNASPYIGTPEKDHINQYNYIFDLHHLPVFDENTGEFFWSSNEANWKLARDSILKTEELQNGRSLSLNHGSLVSLTSSFVHRQSEDDNNLNTEQKWIHFKKDGSSGTFIDELNNLLKNFEN